MKDKVILYVCILGSAFVSFFSSLSVASDKSISKKEDNYCSNLQKRWTTEKANQWYNNQPWPVGIYYITSNAVNPIEMWQEDTFDPKLIDKELGWAEDLGFNTVRVALQDLLWDADSIGFTKRIGQFLDILEKHGMKAVVTFFTNGGAGVEPFLGKQLDPIPGVHCSRWQQSPGVRIVNSPTHDEWDRLERYIKGVIGTFRDDRRVLMWFLYNEPENDLLGANSMPLLRKTFEWARSVNPSQPLTSPIMVIPATERRSRLDIVSFLGENCDVITFHDYNDENHVEKFIKLLKPFNRPIICTEFFGRPKSRFDNILPLLKKENVGAIVMGMVAGKCAFFNPRNGKKGDPEPKIWYHDFLRQDGTPYDQQEIEIIKLLVNL